MNSIRRKLIGLFPKIAGSYIEILTPPNNVAITIGTPVSITGKTDFPIGTEFDVFSIQNGISTFIGKAQVVSYSSVYEANLFGLLNWSIDGEAGSLTIKVSCGDIEDTVTVTLVAASQLLSITSEVTADTPSVYVNHTDVSITSTVTADTPTNI